MLENMKKSERQIITHNVLHLHAKPSRDSERVSQGLMGWTVTPVKTNESEDWVYIEGRDAYRGWVEKRHLAPMPKAYLTQVTAIFVEVRSEPRQNAPVLVRLPTLCKIIVTGEEVGGWQSVTLPSGEKASGEGASEVKGWMPSGALMALPEVLPIEMGFYAARISRDFLGTPYLWGGSSSFGLDCSGFVQYCYYRAGLTLRRDADIQRDDPRFAPIEKSGLLPGDLVFFGKPDKITHVGMHLEGNTFIHSAGGVGCILTDWGDEIYSPRYVDARRLVVEKAAQSVLRHDAEDR